MAENLTKVVSTITLKLLNIPTYSTTITIFDSNVNLYFRWNDRMYKRSLRIESTQGTCLLENTILNVGEPINLNVNAISNDLDCQVMLVKADISKKSDIYNWSDGYILTFYKAETVIEDDVN